MSESEPEVAGADLHSAAVDAGIGTSRTPGAGCTLAARLPPAMGTGGPRGTTGTEVVRRAMREESVVRVGETGFGVNCQSIVRRLLSPV